MPAKKCKSSAARPQKLSPTRLDEMIDEATVDCYNEAEQITGIFTMLEEDLEEPTRGRKSTASKSLAPPVPPGLKKLSAASERPL